LPGREKTQEIKYVSEKRGQINGHGKKKKCNWVRVGRARPRKKAKDKKKKKKKKKSEVMRFEGVFEHSLQTLRWERNNHGLLLHPKRAEETRDEKRGGLATYLAQLTF